MCNTQGCANPPGEEEGENEAGERRRRRRRRRREAENRLVTTSHTHTHHGFRGKKNHGALSSSGREGEKKMPSSTSTINLSTLRDRPDPQMRTVCYKSSLSSREAQTSPSQSAGRKLHGPNHNLATKNPGSWTPCRASRLPGLVSSSAGMNLVPHSPYGTGAALAGLAVHGFHRFDFPP